MRRLGRAKRTEDAYVGWIRRFILANGKRHPEAMGVRDVEAFLILLAARDHVAPSMQNQVLAALLFLYREVLGRDLPWMDVIRRAKRPRRLPTVLSEAEVMAVLARMEVRQALMAALLYGTGMRLVECVRLRIKNVDVARNEIVVRDGESDSDGLVPLALSLRAAMMQQCEREPLHRAGK
nr:phage integrase N-terminal SAM-like domain-containing protein [Xanthomonas nasturtii]